MAICALNPGSVLNSRTLNPGTAVFEKEEAIAAIFGRIYFYRLLQALCSLSKKLPYLSYIYQGPLP